jgi:hypothetical protein
MENLKRNSFLKIPFIRALVFVLILLMTSGCLTGISTFDQQAYTTTASLKVDALCLMDSAQDKYTNHINEVNALSKNLMKIYEYEKHRPKNEKTVEQWDLLLNKDGHLLGAFLSKWEKGVVMNPAYISSRKEQISTAFDLILGLEIHKNQKK